MIDKSKFVGSSFLIQSIKDCKSEDMIIDTIVESYCDNHSVVKYFGEENLRIAFVSYLNKRLKFNQVIKLDKDTVEFLLENPNTILNV